MTNHHGTVTRLIIGQSCDTDLNEKSHGKVATNTNGIHVNGEWYVLLPIKYHESGGIKDEFNKSHSMGYSVIALQTAYLKAHYPVAFYCSVLNSVCDDNSKINKYVSIATQKNIEVLPPNINESGQVFSVVDNKILFGLQGINSIGENVVRSIISERETNGAYKSIPDLMERVPQLTVKQVTLLIKAGAFGTMDKDELLKKFLQYNAMNKFKDLEYKPYKPVKTVPTKLVLKTQYGIETDDKEERIRLYNEKRKIEHETVLYEQWKVEKKEKIKKEYNAQYEKYSADKEYWEYEALSIFLTDNPFREVHSFISRPFSVVEDGDEFVDVGIISNIQKKKDKNKRTYCYINMYSYSGVIEGICFATKYNQFIDLIQKGNKIAVFGERSGEDTFVIKEIELMEDWMDRVGIRKG